MSRHQSRLPIVLLAGVAALAACKKTGSAPTGYGVNVTIDGTMLSSAQRASITAISFTVVDDTQPMLAPFKHTLDQDIKQLQGGKVTFQYVPAATVVNTDTLELGVDVLAGTALIGSGASGKVPLKATAVDATIMLAGLGDGGVTGDGGGDGGAGKTNGVACVTGDECNSTFCTDGVCCNEKCTDVCVSCNESPSTKGTCTPYGAGTDPEMECAAVIPTLPPTDDGGTTTAEAGTEGGASPEAGSSDAAAPSGDAATDADNSDAVVINPPDGGFVTMPKSCGGTCGGARSCKYPGTETSCGKAFCNTHREQASFVCDGNGGCGTTLTECKDYSCDDGMGVCGSVTTGCSQPSQCLAEDYCTGDGKCTSKKGNSISCSLPSECASGNCSGDGTAGAQKVCCNTGCDGMGLTCIESGHVGQCQCAGVTCATGIACQVFYVDADHDTYGDATGTIANGRAVAGCAGSPPTGYVADNTDCDDANSNAHPGQTTYFGAPRTNGTFDYDCNGTEDKLTHEYVGGVCHFCGGTANCAATSSSCTGTAATGSFQCPLEPSNIGIIEEPVTTLQSTSETIATPGLTSRAAQAVLPPTRPIYYDCCGCKPDDKSGFTASVKCGAYAYKHTCGTCNGSSENADSLAYTQQTCR